jgi:V8-like Glu-specific endopeptidase
MKKFIVISLLLTFTLFSKVIADEGMWLPILLGDYAEAEMQRLGMKITAEDIYSINKASLKDAIVLFGGGCTAEIISKKGLILTNHHCGYSAIQSHSSIEKDYLTNGFWAQNHAEELSNPSLKVGLLISMEDVTKQVMEGVKDEMNDVMKQTLINANITAIEAQASKGMQYTTKVKPFYYGNQYFLIISLTYRDVRLVGTPPNSIGNFGGDTDNWMWPRHTADFTLFRIYAGKDNMPADYSADNVPYTPARSLDISLKGVKKGDFTFVFGYPGTTQEYITSWGVEQTAVIENPVVVKLREKRLGIMDRYMKQNKGTFIQYTAKYQGVANYWKKMKGESNGIKHVDGIKRKKEFEKKFADWANANEATRKKYGNLLRDFEALYKKSTPLNLAADYLYEAGMGVELVRFANNFSKISDLSKKQDVTDKEISAAVDQMKKSAEGFFKNYNASLDKEVMVSLFGIWYKDCDPAWTPDIITNTGKADNGAFLQFAENIYATSFMTSKEKVMAFLDTYNKKKVKKLDADPALKLARAIYGFNRDKVSYELTQTESKIESLNKQYMKAQMEMQPDKHFYPDANSTLRIAYGTVNGFNPRDGVEYDYYTTLDGIIQKEDTSVYDYKVDSKLKELYNRRDYGDYADADGSMHVCFIATNHTSGGNSGSPVLNAYGQLVGINFDRVWEGTMSDLIYDPNICRNISLDIRYCLFIIDKYAGAKYLIDEMNIVK